MLLRPRGENSTTDSFSFKVLNKMISTCNLIKVIILYLNIIICYEK